MMACQLHCTIAQDLPQSPFEERILLKLILVQGHKVVMCIQIEDAKALLRMLDFIKIICTLTGDHVDDFA
jgi:hypothetical protein